MAGAGYRDFTAGQVLTAAQVDNYLQEQVTMVFANAAARDAALLTVKAEGMVTYQLDVNTLTVYTGAVWSNIGPVHGLLSQYTPTLVQSGTVTKTVAFASYQQVGRMVHGNVTLTATGAGTAANAVVVGLPIAAATSVFAIGSAYITDASAGILYGAVLNLASSTTANMIGDSATAALGVAKFTAALAAGDTITYMFTYPAAAD